MVVKIQSVEPNIADLVNGWLRAYGLDYKLEQEHLNDEIDKALNDYFSKTGGVGANRPDAKLLLKDEFGNFFPILIEYKGYKDKLVKLNADHKVENRDSKNNPLFKNINAYAVNGAVHYANALLHYTSYSDIIAIGVTGFKDGFGNLNHEIGVYFVSKSNFGIGQEVGKFEDLSFLRKENFDTFIKQVKNLTLSVEEIEKIKQQREKEIDASLMKLNNDIYKDESLNVSTRDRIYLVAGTIIATLGIPGKVAPLEKEELKSRSEKGYTDGELIMRKIENFLEEKHLPQEKKNLILRTLSNAILSININEIVNGETIIKKLFVKIIEDLGVYYKIGLTTDFTGKLFNEMYSWMGFAKDSANDVVLTPTYVSKLLVQLARVNKDSYVWDFATGSAGLLVAAMNEMLLDAKNTINSPDLLFQKELQIKSEQLLGVEVLDEVYMLAVLNMILMGDGSSNILHKDSLNFDGKYGFGKIDKRFPADAFILNPPYSKPGKGMIFVEKALSMMQKGYAAIIIQNSAGSGQAKDFNRKILQKNTLIASIKMPADLFVGKAGVQTCVYVFKVGEEHHKDEMVKFIDFSNDGYTRTARKKASNNLKDTGDAMGRYEELVNLVRFGKTKLSILTEKEYCEDTIDPDNGADRNFDQHQKIDTQPTLADFKKTVADYLSREVSQILQNQKSDRLVGN